MISFGRAPCDEGVIRAVADTPGSAARARPWVLAATILGSSMAFIDGSVVTVALPAIQADLTTSVAGAQWVANAYMLMLGALILARWPVSSLYILGLFLGIGAAALLLGVLAATALETILFKVKPLDPFIYLVVAGLLTLVAAISCFVPARRATRVNPMVALRTE